MPSENPVRVIEKYMIGGIQVAKIFATSYCRSEQSFMTCTYHGQVNPTTGEPSGLGLAINTEGQLYEGYFVDGTLKHPQLITYYNGNAALQMQT